MLKINKSSQIDSKRGETEVRRRSKAMEKPYVSNMLSSPVAKNTSSQANYNQFETLDHSITQHYKADSRHNMSLETLQSLKNKRSNRRCNTRKFHNGLVNGTTPESDIKSKEFLLPKTREAKGMGNVYQTNKKLGHTRHASTDSNFNSQTTKSPYSGVTTRHSKNYKNIWASERLNTINRQKQTEEMRNMLKKQKIEHLAKVRLENQMKQSEFNDMEDRIKMYINDIQNDIKNQVDKRTFERKIMSENISTHNINKLNRTEVENREISKESPDRLIQREKVEELFQHKRISDRKLLDLNYKREIESRKKSKYDSRSLEKSEANNSRSFLERFNEK